MKAKIRVLIAEDHATVRGALKALLDIEADIEVIGEAADGEVAVELANQLVPDLILMDIAMPNLDGARATRRVKGSLSNTKVLVLSRHDEVGYLKKLLAEGADGYVLKQSSSTVLVEAIRQVAAGNAFLDPVLAASMMSEINEHHHSDQDENTEMHSREVSTLKLIARGYSIEEIAKELDLSKKSIENAKATGMHKLGLVGRVDIVRYAIKHGWIEDE